MRSLRTDVLATAWSSLTLVAWIAPLAAADFWTAPVAASAAAGLAAGAFFPGRWLRTRDAARTTRACERLGVRRFKMVVVFGDLMNRALARLGWSRPFPYTPERLERWMLWTRVTERIHWAWLAGSLPAVWAAFHAGEHWLGAYVLCGNLPFNVYPILLQRYTRARLGRIRKRIGQAPGLRRPLRPPAAPPAAIDPAAAPAGGVTNPALQWDQEPPL